MVGIQGDQLSKKTVSAQMQSFLLLMMPFCFHLLVKKIRCTYKMIRRFTLVTFDALV